MAGPLEGLKVLDFTWMLSGPYCTMLLGDMGAEIIKIERLPGGDRTRTNGPFIQSVSSYFLSINRGKKSVTLNLASEEGKTSALNLAKYCDVAIENFAPGTIDRLGLGYDQLVKINPNIIYASISGFGQSGPMADVPAYDTLIQAYSGLSSITGELGRPPLRVGFSIADIQAGIFCALAILSALYERQKSGKGQRIDISMIDCMVALLENAFIRYFATGEVPPPAGNRHPIVVPNQIFHAKDAYMVLIASTDDQWESFCKVAGRMDLAEDLRFKTRQARSKNHSALEPILIDILKTRTVAEWVETLHKVSVPAGPVYTIDQVAQDETLLLRDMFVEVDLNRGGKVKLVGTPLKFLQTPAQVNCTSPELGEHTEEILSRMLGLSKEEIAGLRERKVI